ncbi:hypothetical protein OTK01_000409 [Caldicellulosiruptor acetigenus]|uniref:hypothetical protein n=1 Tax=Caldicellulosiruptor acetigenus TaxID=301953 RepID=UPI0022A994A9|nr:hypothetical protein [Caldicellulosiruptor acetigenus]WAM36633.1 hypothetical protein OTK01_000409 [Caldicellulosiruptor acetigenus]
MSDTICIVLDSIFSGKKKSPRVFFYDEDVVVHEYEYSSPVPLVIRKDVLPQDMFMRLHPLRTYGLVMSKAKQLLEEEREFYQKNRNKYYVKPFAEINIPYDGRVELYVTPGACVSIALDYYTLLRKELGCRLLWNFEMARVTAVKNDTVVAVILPVRVN